MLATVNLALALDPLIDVQHHHHHLLLLSLLLLLLCPQRVSSSASTSHKPVASHITTGSTLKPYLLCIVIVLFDRVSSLSPTQLTYLLTAAAESQNTMPPALANEVSKVAASK